MSSLFASPKFLALDSAGNYLPGAQLYFTETASSTPLAVYADRDLNTPLSNPVIADAYGVFVPIWLQDQQYRVRLTSAAGVTQWTVDEVGLALDADAIGAAMYPISTAETNYGLTVADLVRQYPYGDVRRYYDGSGDYSAALQRMFDLPYVGVTQPDTTYTISAGLTITQDDFVWESNGCTITTSADIDAITIGPLGASTYTFRAQVRGYPRVINTGSSTKAGWKLQQVYSSELELSAQGFYVNVHCYTSGAGCVYNDIKLGVLWNPGYVNVLLEPTSLGWVNENLFTGGRFAANTGAALAHIYAKYGTGGYPQPNNNVFVKPSLETTGHCQWAIYDDGLSNQYIQPRIEGTWTNTTNINPGGTTVNGNVLFGTYSTGSAMTTSWYDARIVDLGKYSKLSTGQRIKLAPWGGAEGFNNTMLEVSRDFGNIFSKPLVEFRDGYQGAGTSEVIRAIMSRSATTGSYFLKCYSIGQQVTNGGRYYECLTTHTSAAADEPGVGANWQTYWKLNSAIAGTATAWAATTSYTGRVEKYTIGGQGQVTLQTHRTGTAAPTANANYVGELFINTSADDAYIAIQVGAGAADWKKITP